MTLEEFTAQLNGSTFWKEFTFSQNQFSPRPGQELELADSFVWLGETAFVIQMKERAKPTDDPDIEKRWFKDAILRTAVRQIKDSIRFLSEHDAISIANERGQRYDVSSSDVRHLEKIILYAAGASLPEDCRRVRYHVSQTAGFIHIFQRDDYRQVVQTLAVPEEVRRYFRYRETSLIELASTKTVVDEPDILAAYMFDEALPTARSHKALARLIDDHEKVDIAPVMNRLADHIQNSDGSSDYTRILIEFAKLPRSGWRAVKERLDLSISQAMKGEFDRSYRFQFPPNDCSFMFSPFFPGKPTTGPEGEEARRMSLQNLTAVAKYLAKTSKGIGVLVSKDGDHLHLDWCLIEHAWEQDADLDARLQNHNLFGAVREKKVDGYYFRNL
ncbi:hypothetical protein [Rhizobium sp. No.120]